MCRHIGLHGDLNSNQFAALIKKHCPEIKKYGEFSAQGARLLEESLDNLFNLMDTERDGVVDQEEMEDGLREMFPPSGQDQNPFGAADSMLSPPELFAKIDAD